MPLEERRARLKQLPLAPPLRRVVELNVSGSEPPAVAGGHRGTRSTPGTDTPWEVARLQGWEGVIAKRRGSTYEQRRSRNWLKMKCELAQEFVVGGFTDPQGKRVGLGALLVGYYEKSEPPAAASSRNPTVRQAASKGRVMARGSSDMCQPDFVFAGKIGTGFNNELLLDLRHKLDALEIPKAPFTKAVGLPRLRAHWVRPEIVVQVGFIQWTGHGKLRHPRLLHVRTDKNAREVVRE
jgi:ATP-dependent DNA ligase